MNTFQQYISTWDRDQRDDRVLILIANSSAKYAGVIADNNDYSHSLVMVRCGCVRGATKLINLFAVPELETNKSVVY